MEMAIDTPMIHINQGKTKSATVMPFHLALKKKIFWDNEKSSSVQTVPNRIFLSKNFTLEKFAEFSPKMNFIRKLSNFGAKNSKMSNSKAASKLIFGQKLDF